MCISHYAGEFAGLVVVLSDDVMVVLSMNVFILVAELDNLIRRNMPRIGHVPHNMPFLARAETMFPPLCPQIPPKIGKAPISV